MLQHIKAALAASFLIGSAIAAQAAVITYDFTGISRADATASVQGSFSFDTMAAPNSSGSVSANYPLISFEVLVSGGSQDGGAFDLVAGEIQVTYRPLDSPVGIFDVVTPGGLPGGGLLAMSDGPGTFISSTDAPDYLDLIPLLSSNSFIALLDTGLGLPDGTSAIDYGFGTGQDYDFTSIEERATVVPLPAGVVLLGSGLGAAAFAARRRKTAA